MLVFSTKVFDGFLNGTSNVYTHTASSELLGSVERLMISAVLKSVTGINPTLTLQLENSPDGSRWLNQSSLPELGPVSLSVGDSMKGTANFGSRTKPIGPYVRVRIALGGTSPTAYLRLWASGRTPAY